MQNLDPFKAPRSNWKYILIVAILAAILGGGVLGYQYLWLLKEEISAPIMPEPTVKLEPIRLFYSMKSNVLATVYEIDINGENQIKMMDFGPVEDSWANLSPNGKEIIFDDGNNGILIYNLNTKQRELILKHQSGKTNGGLELSMVRTYRKPLWSPNGSLIALDTGLYEGAAFTVIDTQGKKIIEKLSFHADYFDWANGSQKIAVTSFPGMGVNSFGLYLFDLEKDTEAKQILPEETRSAFFPQWSPDDQKIALALDIKGSATYSSKLAEIFTINLDGSELSQVTHTDGLAQYPVWANDSKEIAYGVRENDTLKTNQGIYLIAVTGDKNMLLYRHDNYQWHQPLEWSPDGRYLLFLMGKKPADSLPREGSLALAVVSRDGRESRIIAKGEDITFVGWRKKQ